MSCLLCGALGCQAFPGASIKNQIDELRWSSYTMVQDEGWKGELIYDFEVFSDPELDQLAESLTMIGW
jgi:hypothetical protein